MKLNKPTVYIFLLILTFALYGNSIFNDYALDDAIVITENQFTKKGIEGIKDILNYDTFTGFYGKQKKLVSGGRYRPLSVVTFAIEYELFGLNPKISHIINILLYAFICMLVYNIINILFENNKNSLWFSLAFITALFYAAHPIHTEVVTNIKGRDELMALLGSLLSLKFILNYVENRKLEYLFYASISFFLGLLSKENTITFLAIIPIAIYFSNKNKKVNGGAFIFSILTLIVPTILFLMIRSKVLGGFDTNLPKELMNNPFLEATHSEKFATIFYTLGLYLKLLIFPHPLTYDYYPYHIPILNWMDWKVIVSILVYIAIGIYGIVGIFKRDIKAFAIILFLIPLSIVSNILFPVGVFMSERFVFFSSIGFCLILSWLITHKRFNPYLGAVLTMAILGLYSYKTIDRNKDWKDNFTLFTNDVKISQNSAKGNTSAGGILLDKAKETNDRVLKNKYSKMGLKYLRKAIKIYPTYTDAWILLGNGYYEYSKDADSALYCYFKILSYNKTYDKALQNIEVVLAKSDSADYNARFYTELNKIAPDRFDPNYQLGVYYGKHKNDLQKAIPYLLKAIKIDPGHIGALKDLSVAYGMSGKFQESINILEKAITLKPEDAELYINQGINYRNLGNMIKANEYFLKAQELQKKEK